MQENNFEKQVRQKMDDLRLNPSDELWQKVSMAIAKRKSGRWLSAILFIFLLLIGSGVFITWHQINNSKINKDIVKNQITEKANVIAPGNVDINSRQIIDSPEVEKTKSKLSATALEIYKDTTSFLIEKVNSKQQHIAILAESSKKITVDSEQETEVNNKPGTGGNGKKYKGRNTNSFQLKPRWNVTGENAMINDIAEIPPVSLNKKMPKAELMDPLTHKVVMDEAGSGSNSKSIIGEKGPLILESAYLPPMVAGKKTADKKSFQVHQHPAWKWGFNFSIGGVATQSGVLGVMGIGNGEESKAYADLSQSNSGTTGTTTIPAIAPTNIKPGLGIILGPFVEKNISPKMNFLFGINYKRYSTSMVVGGRVDSIGTNLFNSRNGFYRSGSSTPYKNNFHFLELPVAMQFKLSKKSKPPVFLNTGISIAQLIGSNALQFEPQSGSYYRDKTQLNKTQLNVSGSIVFSLSGNSKNPLLLGPVVNFSVSEMADAGLYKNRHYSYLGIVVQKNIGKD